MKRVFREIIHANARYNVRFIFIRARTYALAKMCAQMHTWILCRKNNGQSQPGYNRYFDRSTANGERIIYNTRR